MADLHDILEQCRAVVATATGDSCYLQPAGARNEDRFHIITLLGGNVAESELVAGEGQIHIENQVEVLTSIASDASDYPRVMFQQHRKAIRALNRFTPDGASAFYLISAEGMAAEDDGTLRVGVIRTVFNLSYFLDEV